MAEDFKIIKTEQELKEELIKVFDRTARYIHDPQIVQITIDLLKNYPNH